VGATAPEQARRCLENLRSVCEAAGVSLRQAVRLTVYMTDLGEFAAVNEVYGSFFAGHEPPARVAVEVSALPKGALVEIDAIVALLP
jgi:2-iminobutanoate/2-iminopropanoate deaminase